MGVKKYIKKPVIIEAIQYTGDNLDEIKDFIVNAHWIPLTDGRILLSTLEGNVTASIDDYIVKGVRGEYYPCKPDVFHVTYNLYDV